jgi:hypothetical protein
VGMLTLRDSALCNLVYDSETGSVTGCFAARRRVDDARDVRRVRGEGHV